MSNEYKDWFNDLSETQKINRELCFKYPFLVPKNRFTGEEVEKYDYDYTELDAMPDGWRKAFGEQMCNEIQSELNKLSEEDRDNFRILQIKEKYGELRFYTNWVTDEIHNIIGKYEYISRTTCIHCGKPATKITLDWISPFCDDCIKLVQCKAVDIDEWFSDSEEFSEGYAYEDTETES